MRINRYNLLTGLIAIGLLFSLVHGAVKVKFNRNMINRIMGDEDSVREASLIAYFDEFYSYHFPAGNLFMHFQGMNPDVHGSFIMAHYFRASYILHPRRVYVVQDNPIIREMKEILADNDIPDPQWLKDHNVTSILTHHFINGQHSNQIRRIYAEGE